MNVNQAKYYKRPFSEGVEALLVNNHKLAFPFHFHPTFNISLIYDGTFNTQLTDKLLYAPSGTILITNPHEIHANPSDKISTVSFFTFYISQGFMQYCNNNKTVVFDQKVIDDSTLFTALHQLSEKINQEDLSFEKELKDTLLRLAAAYGSEQELKEDHQLVSLFEDFITEDNASKFSLEDAAGRFGIDKFKFIRLFKFQTGLTPNNYFIMKRIEKSKALLAEGRDVFGIAIDLGFYDAAHYCNHFKKFTGISPAAYSAG